MLFPRFNENIKDLHSTFLRYCEHLAGLVTARAVLQISQIVSFLFTSLLLLFGGAMLLLLLSVALGLWIGEALKSYPLGFIIAAAVWAVIWLIIYLIRHLLFTNQFIRLLHKTGFKSNSSIAKYVENAQEDAPDPYESAQHLQRHIKLMQQEIKNEREAMSEILASMRSSAGKDMASKVTWFIVKLGLARLLGRRRKSRRQPSKRAKR